jgi:2-amino-4-hydroxy-6-hydroxymethyldihydropteridine diphosphokinase
MNVFLLSGSNINDRINNLNYARNLIAEKIGNVIRCSSIYETAAWGNDNQPEFLNQALQVDTNLLPEQILKMLKSIEESMGRKQSAKWGPRIIDIDILLMDDTIYESPILTIPHPQMHKRRFTLMPLAEIAPDTMHPKLKLTVRELLESCEDKLAVRKTSSASTSSL